MTSRLSRQEGRSWPSASGANTATLMWNPQPRFQDSDDGDLPVLFPDDFEDGVFLNVFPGRLDFYSAGHTHTASVTVEVWDGESPTQDPSQWDEQAAADFESTSGEEAVRSTGRADEVITLSDSVGSWRMRASCTARQQATALSEQECIGKGVEKYLVQFCSAGRDRCGQAGTPPARGG